ncbi:MAG: hypothetical protein GF330_13825 [Candidatus Eisenbacteria bacterium]|nr:hypothetical protein [Candidatus Eisenbacteria bacterium]
MMNARVSNPNARLRRWSLAVLLIPLAGCFNPTINLPVFSLHAPCDATHSRAISKLLGAWELSQGHRELRFAWDEEGYCLARVTTSSDTAYAHVWSADIGEGALLDFFPTEYPEELERHFAFWIPFHMVLRIPALGDTIRLEALDYVWLDSLLTARPEALATEVLIDPHDPGDDPLRVVTSSTQALRDFLEAHWSDSDAWFVMFDAPFVRVAAEADSAEAGGAPAEVGAAQ